MKIVLIGYGKMGKLLEIKAEERGHSIFKVLNKPNWLKEDLLGSDVAIDFSNPNSALENIYKSFQIGIPIVVGTTGWYEEIEKVKSWCNEYNGSILPATNFSLGVNIFFEINKQLSKYENLVQKLEIELESSVSTEDMEEVNIENSILKSELRQIEQKNRSFENELNELKKIIKNKDKEIEDLIYLKDSQHHG